MAFILGTHIVAGGFIKIFPSKLLSKWTPFYQNLFTQSTTTNGSRLLCVTPSMLLLRFEHVIVSLRLLWLATYYYSLWTTSFTRVLHIQLMRYSSQPVLKFEIVDVLHRGQLSMYWKDVKLVTGWKPDRTLQFDLHTSLLQQHNNLIHQQLWYWLVQFCALKS